jgi:hypothetical protein
MIKDKSMLKNENTTIYNEINIINNYKIFNIIKNLKY